MPPPEQSLHTERKTEGWLISDGQIGDSREDDNNTEILKVSFMHSHSEPAEHFAVCLVTTHQHLNMEIIFIRTAAIHYFHNQVCNYSECFLRSQEIGG